MNELLILIFLLSLLAGPLVMGLAGLSLLIGLTLDGIGGYSDSRMILSLMALATVPISIRVSAQLLDGFVGEDSAERGRLCTPVVVGAFVFLFSSIGVLPGIEAAFALQHSPSEVELISWAARLGAAALFCAFLASVVIAGLTVVIELPVRLVVRGSNVDFRIPYAALRQGMVVVGVVLALDLIGGLLARELSPPFLLATLVK